MDPVNTIALLNILFNFLFETKYYPQKDEDLFYVKHLVCKFHLK